MYELLKQALDKEAGYEDKTNKAREFLQGMMLKIIFDRGAFDNLAFVGGTALRVLFGLRRYSEDLDFSLIKKQGYLFKKLMKDLVFELEHYGFRVEAVPKETNIVHSAMVKFPGLPESLGLSKMASQNLSIKLEIDTNPPGGWRSTLTPVTSSFVYAVKHFDLPSLYATKLHACFFRHYAKGRDFYDLVWYLGKKVTPNFTLLNNAIIQTEKKDLNIGPDNLKAFMARKMEKIDFSGVRRDVERFLEDKKELNLLNKDIIMQMLG
ncbi:MAG: nucleotidyl transferase AbiEii/AbiGii toxin family protein [Planctomycetota bacterium]